MHADVSVQATHVEHAIATRRSVRAFLRQPVDRELVERMLALAGRAPSGANMQPWKIHVLMGEVLASLTSKMTAHYMETGREPAPEFDYYPRVWREPYLARRREVGYALYASLGIPRGDRPAMQRQQARNYMFFGAPVGLVFTADRDLEAGSLLDIGMFMQNLMVLAVANGLATCAQGAIAYYHEVIRSELRISQNEMILCGMSLGWPDWSAPENVFPTTRLPVEQFAIFHESM